MSSQSFEKIKVFARLKPSDIDRSQKVVKFDKNEIVVNLNDDPKHFCFDGVFGEESNQEEVFNGAASRIVQGTLQGYNGTIFAYGQTGSGKTHTMIGPPKSASTKSITTFDEESGIIPRSLHLLFDMLNKKKMDMPEIFSFNVSISFVEIYNENIYDLFEMNDEKLKIGQDNDGNAMVKGTTEKVVKDFNDAMEEVKRGWNNRSVASTEMNRTSSRSHALLLIKIHTGEVKIDSEDGSISHSHSAFLNLVDLAGSERVSQSKVEGERLKETANINKSLLTLKIVIRELSEKNKSGFVAFRNSVLTHILKDSLGGNARTAVMINVHSDKMYYSETLSTLQFSAEVSRIQNKVEVNEKLEGDSVSAYKVAIRRLQDEIDKMKTTNAEERAELQRSLDAWKEAAIKYERQLAVARKNAINAAIVCRNGGDAAAALADTVWERSMAEVAERAHKLPTSSIKSVQLMELTELLDLCTFEKEELKIQLDDERKAKAELQERLTRHLDGTMSPLRGRQPRLDSSSSQEGSSTLSSMLGNPLEATFALPSSSKKDKDRRLTMYTPSRNRQSAYFRPVRVEEGQMEQDPIDTENAEERRELELEVRVNTQTQIIDEKTQECQNLSRLLQQKEEECSNVHKSVEEEREKLEKLKEEMEDAEKKMGEMREKVAELERSEAALNEDLIAANSQVDRLTSDMALLQSTHEDKMEELEKNLKSNMSDKEKKEVDLKSEIDRLRKEIECRRIDQMNKETEKQEAHAILTMMRDKLIETEKEKSAKIQELESATSQIHELMEAMHNNKEKMEEERMKSEKEHKEKMRAVEEELELKKKEIEEERKKTTQIEMSSSIQMTILQDEMESLRIVKDNEMRAKLAEKEKDIDHWKTVSHQFSEKMDEMKKELMTEKAKCLDAEASAKNSEAIAKRMNEVIRLNATENVELKENISALGSHANSKQKIHLMSRYVEDKRILQARVLQLESTLEKHGIRVPQGENALEVEEDEGRNGQRDSILSDSSASGASRRPTRAVASSSSTAASAASSKTSVRSTRTTAARK